MTGTGVGGEGKGGWDKQEERSFRGRQQEVRQLSLPTVSLSSYLPRVLIGIQGGCEVPVSILPSPRTEANHS